MIVLFDSAEAATYRTGLSGWVNRDGHFFGDGEDAEASARYAGCTHKACASCGEPAPKAYIHCDTCRQKASDARYQAMPVGEWDGEAQLYSEVTERFYPDPEEALEDADDPKLILCVPVYARRLDDEFFADLMPEDADLPEELARAIEVFNVAVAGVVLSWEPGTHRLPGPDFGLGVNAIIRGEDKA